MEWVKIDCQILRNEKVAEAGVHGMLLYLDFLCLNRIERLEGVIPARKARISALTVRIGHFLTREQLEAALDACIKSELLSDNADGTLSIVGWDSTWETPLSGKERSARHRAKQGEKGATKRKRNKDSVARERKVTPRESRKRRESREKQSEQSEARSASNAVPETTAPDPNPAPEPVGSGSGSGAEWIEKAVQQSASRIKDRIYGPASREACEDDAQRTLKGNAREESSSGSNAASGDARASQPDTDSSLVNEPETTPQQDNNETSVSSERQRDDDSTQQAERFKSVDDALSIRRVFANARVKRKQLAEALILEGWTGRLVLKAFDQLRTNPTRDPSNKEFLSFITSPERRRNAYNAMQQQATKAQQIPHHFGPEVDQRVEEDAKSLLGDQDAPDRRLTVKNRLIAKRYLELIQSSSVISVSKDGEVTRWELHRVPAQYRALVDAAINAKSSIDPLDGATSTC